MLSLLGVFLPAEQLLAREYCKAGDLLEIDHKLYAHWAVYVGHHEVVHIPESEEREAVVERSLLASVAGDCLVRVNNKEVPAKGRGLAALPCGEVVGRALRCVGTNVSCNIVVNNSEHFVTRLKYGVEWSDQAKAMQRSTSLLFSSPSSPKQVSQAHQDIWSEIHTILSSSPPVSPSSLPSSSSSSSFSPHHHPPHRIRTTSSSSSFSPHLPPPPPRIRTTSSSSSSSFSPHLPPPPPRIRTTSSSSSSSFSPHLPPPPPHTRTPSSSSSPPS